MPTDPPIRAGSHVEAERLFLQAAIELAVENATAGQLPFGAVLMIDDAVVATGGTPP